MKKEKWESVGGVDGVGGSEVRVGTFLLSDLFFVLQSNLSISSFKEMEFSRKIEVLKSFRNMEVVINYISNYRGLHRKVQVLCEPPRVYIVKRLVF